ncbi:hypothetical protein E3J85_00175 [Patescibacteria group bacterium]|nr:MAG: hypothetical protein E3J85_00175 [Patescibacteria group bacterium]
MAKIDQKGAGEDGQGKFDKIMEEINTYFNGGESEFSGMFCRRIRGIAGDNEIIMDRAYRAACKKHGTEQVNHIFGVPSPGLVESMKPFKEPG